MITPLCVPDTWEALETADRVLPGLCHVCVTLILPAVLHTPAEQNDDCLSGFPGWHLLWLLIHWEPTVLCLVELNQREIELCANFWNFLSSQA